MAPTGAPPFVINPSVGETTASVQMKLLSPVVGEHGVGAGQGLCCACGEDDGARGVAEQMAECLCDSDEMNFGRDANPLLVTIFLAVWTLVGILYLINDLKAM